MNEHQTPRNSTHKPQCNFICLYVCVCVCVYQLSIEINKTHKSVGLPRWH